MNIDKIEFEWHNIENIDEKMVMELINSKERCLVKRRDGNIEVANILWSVDFITSLESDDEFSHTDSTTEVFREWVEEFAEHEEFILYSAEYYEEYGEYAGRTLTILDDAIEIALIPDNPIINAIYNYNY